MNNIQYGSVGPPWWDDQPAIIVGTGPSLHGFDFERLRGLGHVLAVKEAWKDLPFADACFGLDMPWLIRGRGDLIELAQRIKLYAAVPYGEANPRFVDVPGAVYVKRQRVSDRLSTNSGAIESAGHSGFGALNIAFLKRAKLIVLFGYDYHGGHYCPDRYRHNPPGHNQRYLRNWASAMNTAASQLKAAGVSVINASPKSAINAFPKMSIDATCNHLRGLRCERERSLCGSAGECAEALALTGQG